MTFAVIACGAAIDDEHKKAEGVARLVSVFCKAVWRYTYTFPAFVYVNRHLAKAMRRFCGLGGAPRRTLWRVLECFLGFSVNLNLGLIFIHNILCLHI